MLAQEGRRAQSSEKPFEGGIDHAPIIAARSLTTAPTASHPSGRRKRCCKIVAGISPAADLVCGAQPTHFEGRGLNIFSNTVVTLSYKLFSPDGTLIEESSQPITYLHGGHHGIFPKIEAALAQKKVGESCSVMLEPDDAFGEYDADLVRVEPQDRFPPDIKVGMQFEGHAGPDGQDDGEDDEMQVYTVTDIADGKVVVDGNHPLAGQRLRFDCTVLDIRPATAEEMSHGHVHGPDGHHH
jgi:FKBP-type peptidyl-prolyl cis-trans isomerase SlyD